jgi:SpoVK/Ycf46/Vps4 family AAA+-type ATPase
VIRPSLPFDIMGSSVGETEDTLIALFSFAKCQGKRCILLLDDVENICGQAYNGPTRHSSDNPTNSTAGEPHVLARSRSVFLSALDTLKKGSQQWGSELLIICTSKYDLGQAVDRFDKVFSLVPPNVGERRSMIVSYFDLNKVMDGEALSFTCPEQGRLLSGIVECTVGLSYAELSQACRQTIQATYSDEKNGKQTNRPHHGIVLQSLKQNLQASVPESLRSGANDDFMDLTVLTARDMLGPSPELEKEGAMDLPLFGQSAESAWKELMRLIVMPLSRANVLDKLLHKNGGKGGKTFCGGVLLTGPPGSGKSAIAYHCATIAATLMPSVKLIDVSCTSLIHKEVGGSERSIHRLFESARAAAPCILLMDGIENVAAVRGNDNTTEGTMDRVLSTLLTELDGVDNDHFSNGKAGGIAIIGITHNVDWIDPALQRPGRLEKVIELGRPEEEARRRLVFREIEQTPFLSKEDTSRGSTSLEDWSSFVAGETEGMTGAGVIACCNEAKMQCAREIHGSVITGTVLLTRQHFEGAIQSQRAGSL